MKIVRWILTVGMCVCVYLEAGLMTAISLFLIFIAIELRHLPLKADRPDNLQAQIDSIRKILSAQWEQINRIIEKQKED